MRSNQFVDHVDESIRFVLGVGKHCFAQGFSANLRYLQKAIDVCQTVLGCIHQSRTGSRNVGWTAARISIVPCPMSYEGNFRE